MIKSGMEVYKQPLSSEGQCANKQKPKWNDHMQKQKDYCPMKVTVNPHNQSEYEIKKYKKKEN